MKTRELILGIVVTLAVLAVVGGLVGVCYVNGAKNRAKVIQLTQFCVDKGYSAWTDKDNGMSLCIGRGQ